MTSPLLASSCDHEAQLDYYKDVLLNAQAASIEVQIDVDGKGKGLVATRNISEGETVFVERPLAHLQHLDNHGSALVCQACLRFVGSVELQIGHKLRCLVEELRGAQRGAAPEEHSNSGDEKDEDGEIDLDGALEAGERLEQIYSLVTPERISELCSGSVKLPLSDDFRLPEPVPCRRGCGAVYCGVACEAAAWEHAHCLLCTAAAPPAAAAAAAAPTPPAADDSAAPGPSSRGVTAVDDVEKATSAAAAEAGPSSSSTVEELHGVCVDRRAMAAFVEHARETNEIFLLAAQVVAATLLRAARLLADGPQQQQEQQQRQRQQEERAAAPEASEATAAAAGPLSSLSSSSSSSAAPGGSGLPGTGACRSALLAAWRPYMYGWKRCWWDSVAVPDDVDDEEEFRSQLRSLASDSLELLSAAITDPRFGPGLLQLEVYGSIVGMFELNNMGLSVPSPVEDYFLAVDEMEEDDEDKPGVTKVTQPLLDALDAEYATPCEATAFMALQSCINHSCDPNCTAACDTADQTVTVLAQRDIPAGEEITLSYIDVSLPYKDRQAELRDYGFVCRCARCVADAAAAARAKRQGAAARGGVKVGRRR